jgi:hypothetical protein
MVLQLHKLCSVECFDYFERSVRNYVEKNDSSICQALFAKTSLRLCHDFSRQTLQKPNLVSSMRSPVW